MKKIFKLKCLVVFMMGLPLCNLLAQNTYVADTLQADGYLSIVALKTFVGQHHDAVLLF